MNTKPPDSWAAASTAQDKAVLAVCADWGFGAVMESAARQWRERDPIGAFTVGGLAIDPTYSELRAEVVRLRAQVAAFEVDWQKRHLGVIEDNERLRAALEKIANTEAK